ncbi:MAG: type I methionyl aminopeptidase [Deltaproteobacteria bacterium]|nr:type I methionyl aminopeptidase [Deltaproteobacteria bacterium]
MLFPDLRPPTIALRGKEELRKLRAAGRLAHELLDYLGPLVKPGVTTEELDRLADAWTTARGAVSAPYGYQGSNPNLPFPKHICTSPNEVVCHGIPSRRVVLREGDIINLDVTPILDGWHGDASRTYLVGRVSDAARRLVETTQQCLDAAIREVKPGGRLGDIGEAIEEVAAKAGYSVVRDFVGHGIGDRFHAPPQVKHYGKRSGGDGRGRGLRLQPGMVFTIEPMINEGEWPVQMLDDGWTAVTADGKLSAQFEHTVVVTESGVEILTLP